MASSSSTPDLGSAAQKPCRKRQSTSELVGLLKKQAERDEEREMQAAAKEEERQSSN